MYSENSIHDDANSIYAASRSDERSSLSDLILFDAFDSTSAGCGREEEFEENLCLLLSKIEQAAAKTLKNGAMITPRVTALLLADFINGIAAFSENLPPYQYDAIVLSQILEQVCAENPFLKRMTVQKNRLTVGLIRNDARRRGGPDAGEADPSDAIIQAEVRALGACLAFFEPYFISPRALKHWKEIHQAFLATLGSLLAADDASSNDADPGEKLKTVLLVQANPALMQSVQTTLQTEGYNVITALGGDEGLEKARREKPELVLLDTTLPGMSGFQVCREIKQSPETQSLPVIMLTNRSQDGNHFKALINDANMYLIKPLDNRELITAVARHI